MKPYIIPIFIPHIGCPHQCVFCNQKRIAGNIENITQRSVSASISEGLSRKHRSNKIEVAYYGGSFTGISREIQDELLAPAVELWEKGKISAIRISTRPDYIEEIRLNELKKQGVSIVELGVQSLNDGVLQSAGRGHNKADVETAVRKLRTARMQIGLQLMVGLPGEGILQLAETASIAAGLQPDFVRLYPVLVLPDTPLSHMHQQGEYKPLSLEEGVRRTAFMKLFFYQRNIPVIRTGLQPTEELNHPGTILAGPYHPAFGELVDAYVFQQMAEKLVSGFFYRNEDVEWICHKKDESKFRRAIKDRDLIPGKVVPSGSIIRNELSSQLGKTRYWMNWKMLSDI